MKKGKSKNNRHTQTEKHKDKIASTMRRLWKEGKYQDRKANP